MLTINMYEEFSASYYLSRLYVRPYTEDKPAMHEDEHRALKTKIQNGDESKPLVVKIDKRYIPVWGDKGVPSSTLALPNRIADEIGLRNPPSLKEVLLLKAKALDRLIEFR